MIDDGLLEHVVQGWVTHLSVHLPFKVLLGVAGQVSIVVELLHRAGPVSSYLLELIVLLQEG